MDTVWRRRANIVGYVDIVISSMAVMFAMLLLLGLALITQAADDPEKMKNLLGRSAEDPEKFEKIAKHLPFFWTFGVSLAVLTMTQLLVAILLLNSTQMGKEYKEAKKKSGIWQTVTLVILGIFCCQAVLSFAFVTLAVTLTIKGVELYVVWKFRDELEVVKKNTFPNPDYVITFKE